MALMRKRSAQDELAMQLSLTMGKVHTHHQQADQQLKLVSQLGITDQEHTLMKKYFQYQTSRDDAQERLTQLESEFTANANGREVDDGDLNHDDDAIIDAAISRLAAPTRLTKKARYRADDEESFITPTSYSVETPPASVRTSKCVQLVGPAGDSSSSSSSDGEDEDDDEKSASTAEILQDLQPKSLGGP